MKFFSKIWVKSNVLKYLIVNHKIIGFLARLLGGNFPQSLLLSPDKPFPLS